VLSQSYFCRSETLVPDRLATPAPFTAFENETKCFAVFENQVKIVTEDQLLFVLRFKSDL